MLRGVAKVFRQKIWMKHYGVQSCKRTCLWSNSGLIQELDLGPLTKEQRTNAVPLAVTYKDPTTGKTKCHGKKKALKESQNLDSICNLYFSFCV